MRTPISPWPIASAENISSDNCMIDNTVEISEHGWTDRQTDGADKRSGTVEHELLNTVLPKYALGQTLSVKCC